MPNKREWDWDDVGVGRAYRKTWDELGITPAQFRIFREASHQHFTTGKRSESNQIWKLLKSGYSLTSLISLAKEDAQDMSCLLGCLLELAKKQKPISRDTLNRVRNYLEHLPECTDPVAVMSWMQLLSLDELSLLGEAGFISLGDEYELGIVSSALEQIRESVNWLPAAQIRLLAELSKRFGMDHVQSAVEARVLERLASSHIEQSNIERESADFESGKYGDWTSLGISNDEMNEIVSTYYEPAVSMKREVASFYKDGANNSLFLDFKSLLSGNLTTEEFLDLIRDGLTADDIAGLREVGLQVSKESISEWSFVEGKVILFCIDNGISSNDRGDIFADRMPPADVVLPWWDYCKKKDWTNRYTRAELLQGISYEDATTDQLVLTTEGSCVLEMLSLCEYESWTTFSGMKGKFKEIEEWRIRGFEAKARTSPPNFEGLDGSSRSDAHAWRYFKFSPKQAVDWSSVKLMERLMPGLSPREAAKWRDAGVKPDEVKIWFDHDIKTPSEAAAWIATGATPQVAYIRKRAGVVPRNV